MRKELIAAVSAFALMTGAAFAQTSSTDTSSPGGTSDAAGMTTQNGAGTSNATGTSTGTTGDQAQSGASTSSSTSMDSSSMSASAEEMMGKTVYGANDEKIGEVEDVILGTDGQPQQLVVSSGGFLGIGAKQIAIDVSQAKLNAEEERVDITGMTQQDVESMPEFEYNDSMTSLNRGDKGDAKANKPDTMNAPAPATGTGTTATPMGGAATGSNNVNGGTSGQ